MELTDFLPGRSANPPAPNPLVEELFRKYCEAKSVSPVGQVWNSLTTVHLENPISANSVYLEKPTSINSVYSALSANERDLPSKPEKYVSPISHAPISDESTPSIGINSQASKSKHLISENLTLNTVGTGIPTYGLLDLLATSPSDSVDSFPREDQGSPITDTSASTPASTPDASPILKPSIPDKTLSSTSIPLTPLTSTFASSNTSVTISPQVISRLVDSTQQLSLETPVTNPDEEVTSSIVDSVQRMSLVVDELATEPPSQQCTLFIGTEGFSHEDSSISILQIFNLSTNHIYLIDILCLKDKAFTTKGAKNENETLKSLLESSQKVRKACFDVRNVSKALYKIYGIKLASIIDIQLMKIHSGKEKRHFTLQECIRNDAKISEMKRETWISTKDSADSNILAFQGLGAFYQRPLSPIIVEYCKQNVQLLPELHDHYKKLLGKHERTGVRLESFKRIRDSGAWDKYDGRGMAPRSRGAAVGGPSFLPQRRLPSSYETYPDDDRHLAKINHQTRSTDQRGKSRRGNFSDASTSGNNPPWGNLR